MDKNWADIKDIPELHVSWRQITYKKGIRIEDRNGHTWEEHIRSSEEDDTRMDISWPEEDDARMDTS